VNFIEPVLGAGTDNPREQVNREEGRKGGREEERKGGRVKRTKGIGDEGK